MSIVRPTVVDNNIPAIDKSGLLQTLLERYGHRSVILGGCGIQESDNRQASRLVRARDELPRYSATERRKKRPSLHSTTSQTTNRILPARKPATYVERHGCLYRVEARNKYWR